MASFTFNLMSASILFPVLLFLALVMIRFPRHLYPPLMWFGLLGFCYLGLEALVEYIGFTGGSFALAVQFQRISEILAVSMLIPLMSLLERLFRLPPSLRRTTRLMMWIAVAVTGVIAVVAFAAPELFVSLTRPVSSASGELAANPVRGAHGALYDARNVIMALYAPYAIIVMLASGVRRARIGKVWPIVLGTAIIVFTGLDDVVREFTGRFFFLNSLEFSRYSVGITAFMIGAVVAIMDRFTDYAKEVFNAAGALQSHQDRLRRLARVDQLTGLANRDVLMDDLTGAESRTLSLVDIDFFRTVADAYGTTRANKALVEVARRLQRLADDSGRVYRIGPDRFAVLSHADGDESDVARFAHAVAASVREPVEADSLEIYLTASVGAVLSGPGDGGDTVINHAETALKDAQSDRNAARIYTSDMRQSAERQDLIVNRLNDAIRRGGLSLSYQPVLNAAGRTVAVEALLRWSDPVLGNVTPREFVPIAEDSGMIVPLTEFVIHHALQDLATLPPDSGLTVNVNISRFHLRSRRFGRSLLEALDALGASPAAMTLEIAEDSLVRELSDALPTLEQLRHSGFRVLLDDFGAGYSSLAQLASLPIHGVKIDPHFIAFGPRAIESHNLLRSMINMAKRVGLSVAAEGVERPDQLELLRSLGVDYYQGMHLGEPTDFARAIGGRGAGK